MPTAAPWVGVTNFFASAVCISLTRLLSLLLMGNQQSSENDGSWLCGVDRCGAQRSNDEGFQDMSRQINERRPVADPQEEKRVLETVRLWISLRESAKTDGAAALSTSDIVVRTPLGEVSGIDQVRQHVYCAASPPLVSSTPLAALRQSPGVWTVYRHYVVDRGGTEFTLRQEWLVLCNPDARNGVKTLIAEVVSSLA